jgi:hypothetical protein
MALRLRRGTDAERQLITPAEGELIYTTDTKSLYIGDGTTAGGIIVSGEIGLGDLAEVDLSTPPTVGQALVWDGIKFVPDNVEGTGGSGSISVGADDSTLRVINAGESFLILGGTNISTTSDTEGNITINNDFVQNFAFNALTGTPTTLAGYEITDAFSSNGGTIFGDVNLNFNDIRNVNVINARVFDGNFIGNIFADDSSIVYDSAAKTFLGNFSGVIKSDNLDVAYDPETNRFFGDFLGSLDGDFTGTVTGDLRGSVFGDDSTLLVDAVSSRIPADVIFGTLNTNLIGNVTGSLTTGLISYDNTLIINHALEGVSSEVLFTNIGESQILKIRRIDSGIALDQNIGIIDFEQEDDSGVKTHGAISFWNTGIYISNSSTGIFNETNFLGFENGNLCVGDYSAELGYRLDVKGNTIVRGDITASAFIGSLMSDDSSTIVDGINGNITAPGYIQFGSFTTTERNNLTAANGMVIYNATVDRFQGYQAGGWINLDDGSSAA